MFEYELTPRLSETDGLGHISNTCLPAWFEEARRDLFRIFNPDLGFSTWNLILKKYEIEIHRQIRHDALIRIETRVERIGTRSLTVGQEAFQDDRAVASAITVLVHFDYETQRSVAIPDALRERLERHQ